MVKYAFKNGNVKIQHRGVAQPGSALGSGPRGRRFESSHPDVLFIDLKIGKEKEDEILCNFDTIVTQPDDFLW